MLLYLFFHTVIFGILNPSTSLLAASPTPKIHKSLRIQSPIPTYMIEKIADEWPFLAATLHKLQQKKSTDINLEDLYGQSAIHYAAKLKTPIVISILIEHGADVNLKTKLGRTALQIAATAGNSMVVETLLALSTINVNAQDACNETALYAAAEKGHGTLVEILLKHPTIVIDMPNIIGKTPFAIAFEKYENSNASLRERYKLIMDKIKIKLASNLS